MKNRMMFGMVTVFFLALLTPCWLWAETGAGPVDTPRAKEIWANAPQTPEELLLVIKALFANPDEDGHDFFEKRFGIDRAKWRKSKLSGTVEDEYIGSSSMFPPAPFHFSELSLDRQYKKLYKLEITFYRNPDFRMTPAVTQKILGPPTKISVSSPAPTRDGSSTGAYKITYYYKTEKYHLSVDFMDGNERISKEIYSIYRKHSPEQIKNEQALRRSFEIHKDYLPLAMEITRFKH